MVKGKLVMALDFGREKNGLAAQSSAALHGARSHKSEDGKWTVVKFGPTYSNSYQITDFDEAGLKWLQDHLPKEAATT